MLWQGRRQSSNVEDRRGMSAGGLAVGGGVIGIIIVVLNLLLGGGDASQLPELLPGQQQSQPLSPEEQAAAIERARTNAESAAKAVGQNAEQAQAAGEAAAATAQRSFNERQNAVQSN